MLALGVKIGSEVIVDLRKWGLGIGRVANIDTRDGSSRIGFDFDDRIPILRGKLFDEQERQAELADIRTIDEEAA